MIRAGAPETLQTRTFDVLARDPHSAARAGLLTTRRGTIKTPVFMPVGTHGAVKTVSAPELRELGAQIILGNAYHLYLRPGTALVAKAGGLHALTGWRGPILTDSGGYQIFSLKGPKEITADGVCFRSHIDGSSHRMTPEEVIRIQRDLDSDIWMPLDACLGYPAEKDEARRAARLTADWARRSKAAWEAETDRNTLLFGIVQGGVYEDLRRESLEEILSLDPPGVAIGGLSVGEGQELMVKMLDALAPALPEAKPRYLMGVGYPDDLVRAVERGIDMFDCVVPTRNGRNGTIFYRGGKLLIANREFSEDFRPIDERCRCFTCRNVSRAYLRHLFKVREMLGLRLASLHNLAFFIELLGEMREAILRGDFDSLKKELIAVHSECRKI